MRAILIACLAIVFAACSNTKETIANAEDITSPQLAHAVFFDLKNDDDASIQALVEGCYKYLEPHDGIMYFSAGPRHIEYQREVNDLGFDVALTIVFESTEAQEAYQVTKPHKQFIAEFENNWESVRVFDSRILPRAR